MRPSPADAETPPPVPRPLLASASPPSPAAKENRTLPSRHQRVRDADGFLGTALYLGPVASAKNAEEVYVGVAWDDPTRGKYVRPAACVGVLRLQPTRVR
mmetsp:Transcript_17270/g.38962  ORF Transcript_17270/g.38962 Transcript_17270/m.38962 type:complete len:100 (+) Transcript_17270:58-357(+)